MDLPVPKRKYTEDEKRQLVANLDIEVAHRTRQFESWLADRLENFTIHQEGQVSRIPKQVRAMTMREFGEKYQGNIQAALRGYQKERLVAAGAEASFGEVDKSMRKRKWVEGVEAEMEKNGSKDTETPRAAKTPRRGPSPSPKKVAGSSTGPGTAQRQRLVSATNKVPPSSSRTLSRIPASPSPQKPRPPFNNYTSSNTRLPSRPTSPIKPAPPKSSLHSNQQTHRVPSSSSFNPSLPPKTPIYPGGGGGGEPSSIRLPRKDESMLSLNGSPLANPYQFGMGWFKGIEQAEEEGEAAKATQVGEDSSESQPGVTTNGKPTLKRTKSNIIIRRDPSVAFPSTLNGHSRVNSQSSFYTASSSRVASATHSREPSQSQSQSQSQNNHSLYPLARLPTTHPFYTPPEDQQTPRPPIKHARSYSALVAIPTKDGHLLEFDPLQTSPGSIDALEGITESAKKQAKMEMGNLLKATVDKWKLG